MTVASPAHALPRRRPPAHIIDVLIAERAPTLAASAAWPLARFELVVGRPISPAALDAEPAAVTAWLKIHVERRPPAEPDRAFA